MNTLSLYVVTGIPILVGLAFMFKEAGWPSERERKNRALRSFRSALGATLFALGFIIAMAYGKTPGMLLRDISVGSALRFLYLAAVLFCMFLVGSFVQYSAWDKTEAAMRGRLRKIVASQKKAKDE